MQNLNDSSYWTCSRPNGDNLVDKWRTFHPDSSSVVTNLTQLNNVNAAETNFLLGLFTRADMSYDDKRNGTIDPSLSQMVEKAIDV